MSSGPQEETLCDTQASFSALRLQAFRDGQDEVAGAQLLRVRQRGDEREVARHLAGLDGVERGALQLVGERHEVVQAVQLAALAQRTRPREDGGHRVRGGLLALEVLVVVALHGAVRGLVLVVALRAHQHRRHHGKRAEGARHHVAHHVAVVVLAGPDEAAVGLHHARHGIVDERVEVLDPGFLEARGVLGVVDILEDVLEAVIVLFRDGVLRGEPDVLLDVEGVLEAAAGEALDGRVEVVHALGDAGAVELLHQLARLGAVCGGVHELHRAGTGNAQLRVLVHVAVGVTRDGDGLDPVAHARLDARDGDGRAEHGAVQHGADGAVTKLFRSSI